MTTKTYWNTIGCFLIGSIMVWIGTQLSMGHSLNGPLVLNSPSGSCSPPSSYLEYKSWEAERARVGFPQWTPLDPMDSAEETNYYLIMHIEESGVNEEDSYSGIFADDGGELCKSIYIGPFKFSGVVTGYTTGVMYDDGNVIAEAGTYTWSTNFGSGTTYWSNSFSINVISNDYAEIKACSAFGTGNYGRTTNLLMFISNTNLVTRTYDIDDPEADYVQTGTLQLGDHLNATRTVFLQDLRVFENSELKQRWPMFEDYPSNKLYDLVVGDLNKCTVSSWGSGAAHSLPPACFFGDAKKTSYMTVDQYALNMALGKFEFRATIPNSLKEQVYAVHWNRVDIKQNGTSTNKGGILYVLGNGGTAHSDSVIIGPPTVQETNFVYISEIQLVDESGGGGPPGCGSSHFGSSCNQNSHSSSESGPGSITAKLGSIDVSFSLGKGNFGDSAGTIFLKSDNPSTITTTNILSWNIDSALVEVVTNINNEIEFRAPQCLAVLSYQSGNQRLYFAPKINGVYDTNQTLAGYFLYESATNYYIEDVFGSKSWNYSYNSTEGCWSLHLAPWGKVEKLYEIEDLEETIIETRVVLPYNSTNILAKTETRYSQFPWGNAVVSHVVDPDGLALTTTNTYDVNGNLITSTGPTGYYEHREYDGQKLFRTFYPVGNGTGGYDPNTSRVLTYYYGSHTNTDTLTEGYGQPRTIIETNRGIEVGRTYFVYLPGEIQEYRVKTPGAPFAASDHLLKVTRFYTNGHSPDALKSIRNPDGTKTIYFYETNSIQKTTTVLFGQEDTGNDTNLLSGVRTITVVGLVGEMISRTSFDIASNLKVSSEVFSAYDTLFRPTIVTFLDGTTASVTYEDCCGVASETDKEGTTTINDFDGFNRKIATTKDGVTITNIYDLLDNLLVQKRIGSDASEVILSATSYDAAKRPLKTTNALNEVTSFSYLITNGYFIKTTTYPNNTTRVETNATDGFLVSVTGSAVHPVRYEYGVENGEAYTKEIKLNSDKTDSPEWTKTFTDMLGREYKTVYPDGGVQTLYFNSLGQNDRIVDPDGVTTLFQYNGEGEIEYTAINMDGTNTIDFGGVDRITQSKMFFNTNHGSAVRTLQTAVFAENWVNNSNVVSTIEYGTNGLTVWQRQGGVTNRTDVRYAGFGNRYVTNTFPNGAKTITWFHKGKIRSVAEYPSSGSATRSTTYNYDEHLRNTQVVDSRNGTTYLEYDDLDRVVKVTSPAPELLKAPLVTQKFYDSFGRVSGQLNPDGTTVTNFYYDTGELRLNYGSRVYPAEFGYDSQGRMVGMTNWTTFATSTGARATRWVYDAERGWMTNKLYADNTGPQYTYTKGGRLKTRKWARPITTTYTTNAAGDVGTIQYSDGATLNVTNTYDRAGRLTQVKQGTNTTVLVFDDDGRMVKETYNGWSVTNAFDDFGRRRALGLEGEAATLRTYFYDTANRLRDITNGAFNVRYAYEPNSHLVKTVSFRHNTQTRMTTTKSYDKVNRLLRISSTGTGMVLPESYSYDYNTASQRVRTKLADGSYWIYQYDALGQLTSGKKYWADGTPVPGQQFEYRYDDIGNRISAKEGGDSGGSGLRSDSYTVNNLNQYTARTNAPGIDIIGIANSLATVTVSNETAYRKGEYFQKALVVNNASSAQYPLVTNIATLSGITNIEWGKAYVPKASETFVHDDDGNLTQDGRWTYTWDAENRLVNKAARNSEETVANIAFEYDYRSRRTCKRTIHSLGTYTTNKWVYDGWNPIAEMDGGGALQKSFVWGKDLFGTEQGVGGLVMLVLHTGGNSGTYFPAYDGNANLTALWKGSENDSGIRARYEYDPFHNIIRATGPVCKENCFLASTKYFDWEGGQYYYPFRYYDPPTGRWLSRDPVAENGFDILRWGHEPSFRAIRKQNRKFFGDGPNLHVFVANNPLNKVDGDGLTIMPMAPIWPTGCKDECPYTPFGVEARAWALEDKHGIRDRTGDYRHCVAACLLYKCFPLAIAETAHGLWDTYRENPDDSIHGQDSRDDMIAEQEGRRIGLKKGSCENECLEHRR